MESARDLVLVKDSETASASEMETASAWAMETEPVWVTELEEGAQCNR